MKVRTLCLNLGSRKILSFDGNPELALMGIGLFSLQQPFHDKDLSSDKFG